MTDLTDAIALAIFNEIERARLAAEPGISLARFEEVARAAHAEWTRVNKKALPVSPSPLQPTTAQDLVDKLIEHGKAARARASSADFAREDNLPRGDRPMGPNEEVWAKILESEERAQRQRRAEAENRQLRAQDENKITWYQWGKLK